MKKQFVIILLLLAFLQWGCDKGKNNNFSSTEIHDNPSIPNNTSNNESGCSLTNFPKDNVLTAEQITIKQNYDMFYSDPDNLATIKKLNIPQLKTNQKTIQDNLPILNSSLQQTANVQNILSPTSGNKPDMIQLITDQNNSYLSVNINGNFALLLESYKSNLDSLKALLDNANAVINNFETSGRFTFLEKYQGKLLQNISDPLNPIQTILKSYPNINVNDIIYQLQTKSFRQYFKDNVIPIQNAYNLMKSTYENFKQLNDDLAIAGRGSLASCLANLRNTFPGTYPSHFVYQQILNLNNLSQATTKEVRIRLQINNITIAKQIPSDKELSKIIGSGGGGGGIIPCIFGCGGGGIPGLSDMIGDFAVSGMLMVTSAYFKIALFVPFGLACQGCDQLNQYHNAVNLYNSSILPLVNQSQKIKNDFITYSQPPFIFIQSQKDIITPYINNGQIQTILNSVVLLIQSYTTLSNNLKQWAADVRTIKSKLPNDRQDIAENFALSADSLSNAFNNFLNNSASTINRQNYPDDISYNKAVANKLLTNNFPANINNSIIDWQNVFKCINYNSGFFLSSTQINYLKTSIDPSSGNILSLTKNMNTLNTNINNWKVDVDKWWGDLSKFAQFMNSFLSTTGLDTVYCDGACAIIPH